jgi:type I restriction enzyme S subunit
VTDLPIVPPGWALIPLGEIGQWAGGGTPSKSDPTYWKDGSIPWVSPKDMKASVILDSTDHITESAVKESSVKLIPPNSILFVTRSGILEHTFPVAQSAVPVTVNQDIKALTPVGAVNPGYIAWGARAFEYEILQRCSKDGTTVPSVDTSLLKAFPLPIAPVPEQHRIVEAIESYLTRLDDAMATLERVQRNLKRYRASVLKAAVEGRLVPTEAELARAECREYEPASVLLERILAERRRRWEEAELAKMKAKGKVPKNDTWKAKYVEPAGPDMSELPELPELPEGWCWARTEQCVLTQVGHAFSSKEFIDAGVNLLRGDNIGHGTLRWGDNRRKCIQPEALKIHAHLELKPSDIVLAMDRPIISTGLKYAHVRPSDLPALLVQRVIRLRPSIHIGYFAANLQSQCFLQHLNAEARGGGVPHVSEDQIKDFIFPLPPLAEQARIAQEVERLISTSESSTQLAKISVRRVARLRQSILKWAFEGRLVDQDPTDEPADVLLERIRAELAASHGKKQPRPRRVNPRTASA